MSVVVRPYRRGGWEVDIRLHLPNGKDLRQRRKSPLSSRTGSKRWGEARERELLVNHGRLRKRHTPTLKEFAPRFLEEYCRGERQKASGIQRKKSAFSTYLIPVLGNKRLDEIGNEDVQRLKVKLQKRAASSVNNVLTTLNKLLKVAMEWEVIDSMPCTIRFLPRPKQEAAFWDFAEFERLLKAAETVGPNARMIVALGGQGGLRMGEMIALRWCDLDFGRRFVTVCQNDWRGHLDSPKGGRSGRIDLCQRLERSLMAHQVHSRLLSKEGRVLCREDGSSLTERSVRGLVERTQRLAGLPARGVHTLRHTFGAHLAMRGASSKAIQELMRHADLSMTQRYTHLSPAAKEAAVCLLDQPIPFGDMLETDLKTADGRR